MTGQHLQGILEAVGIWGGVITPVLFAIQYTWLANWWRNSTGRLIIALDACICLARLPRAAELLHGNYHDPGRTWLGIMATLAIPVVILWRMYLFERKRQTRRRASSVRAQALRAAMGHSSPAPYSYPPAGA